MTNDSGSTDDIKRWTRLMRLHRWQVTNRARMARPRVQESTSQAMASNQRWAMDVTHVACGRNGWGHLITIIDCHDRAIVGYQFARQFYRVDQEYITPYTLQQNGMIERFFRSLKEGTSGNMCLGVLVKPPGRSISGSVGTTSSAHTRRSAIRARPTYRALRRATAVELPES